MNGGAQLAYLCPGLTFNIFLFNTSDLACCDSHPSGRDAAHLSCTAGGVLGPDALQGEDVPDRLPQVRERNGWDPAGARGEPIKSIGAGPQQLHLSSTSFLHRQSGCTQKRLKVLVQLARPEWDTHNEGCCSTLSAWDLVLLWVPKLLVWILGRAIIAAHDVPVLVMTGGMLSHPVTDSVRSWRFEGIRGLNCQNMSCRAQD